MSDYWQEQRYLAAFYAAHGRMPGEAGHVEPTGPLFVLAGSLAEFRAFCLDENLRPQRDAVFVDRLEQLGGRLGFRWCTYGTGGTTEHGRLLVEMLKTRQATRVFIPSKRDARLRERDARRAAGGEP